MSHQYDVPSAEVVLEILNNCSADSEHDAWRWDENRILVMLYAKKGAIDGKTRTIIDRMRETNVSRNQRELDQARSFLSNRFATSRGTITWDEVEQILERARLYSFLPERFVNLAPERAERRKEEIYSADRFLPIIEALERSELIDDSNRSRKVRKCVNAFWRRDPRFGIQSGDHDGTMFLARTDREVDILVNLLIANGIKAIEEMDNFESGDQYVRNYRQQVSYHRYNLHPAWDNATWDKATSALYGGVLEEKPKDEKRKILKDFLLDVGEGKTIDAGDRFLVHFEKENDLAWVAWAFPGPNEPIASGHEGLRLIFLGAKKDPTMRQVYSLLNSCTANGVVAAWYSKDGFWLSNEDSIR